MPDTAPGAPTLRRALGRWDLTAIGINQVIGGAIFLMPSQVAALVGAWSPLAFVLIGLASLLVALCFAEVGSRFEGTGGPYLYTRAAFGRFVAFEIGWMQWFTRASSQASIVNGIALALGFYWPGMADGIGRVSMITGLTVALAVINVRGIRQSAWVVNALTIGKLVPLALFIGVGLFFVDVSRLTAVQPVSMAQASAAALALIFVFGGYDVVPVPAGEANDPRRHVPFALVTTVLAITVVMTLSQIVALGTLPNLALAKTPLADAALLFAGAGGALVIGVGSVASMVGNNAGQVLTGSRMLYALAEHGELPAAFGRVHRVYRTPAFSIVFTATVALVLALSGSFVVLATASAVSRLITYTGVCASTLVLRQPRFEGTVKPATFVVPSGALIPVLAILVSLVILAGASRPQLVGGAGALLAGAALFYLNDRRQKVMDSRRRLVHTVVPGVILILALASPAHAQQAVFLVRHAEKIDSSRDPDLSEPGRARAALLARLLKDAGITTIYSSDFKRTIHTAEPLAALLKIHPTVIGRDPDTVVQQLRTHKPTDVVLVVGHSDTVPLVLKGLGCSETIAIDDGEYDNLFVVVPAGAGKPTLLRLRY